MSEKMQMVEASGQSQQMPQRVALGTQLATHPDWNKLQTHSTFCKVLTGPVRPDSQWVRQVTQTQRTTHSVGIWTQQNQTEKANHTGPKYMKQKRSEITETKRKPEMRLWKSEYFSQQEVLYCQGSVSRSTWRCIGHKCLYESLVQPQSI